VYLHNYIVAEAGCICLFERKLSHSKRDIGAAGCLPEQRGIVAALLARKGYGSSPCQQHEHTDGKDKVQC
jgi:hypothetical protein